MAALHLHSLVGVPEHTQLKHLGQGTGNGTVQGLVGQGHHFGRVPQSLPAAESLLTKRSIASFASAACPYVSAEYA